MSNGPIRSDTAYTKRLADLAGRLMTNGSTLESIGEGTPLQSGQLADAIERRIVSNSSDGLTARAAALEAVRNAESAIQKIAGGASAGTVSDLELGCLEAIIEVTGRPATRFNAGSVQMPENTLGENGKWRTIIATARSKINKAAASVGCISVKGAGGVRDCIGTGWCAAGQLVITNRHVVAEMVHDPELPPGNWTIDDAKEPLIDFEATDSPRNDVKFKVTGIAYCAVEDDFDAALVRVTPVSGTLPSALKLDWSIDSLGSEATGPAGAVKFDGKEVYVVGHPYRQLNSDLTASVFGIADGTKRWSPGRVVRIDPNRPSLDHDCSTLGGNSGSCVLSIWGHMVVGMHFGGVGVDATGKGSANIAMAMSRLGPHKLANVLKTGFTA